MKTNEATIFVFTASIIIGILISSSINFKKINNEMFLTPAEYQEAYEYNSNLNEDIDNLTEKYYQHYTKLQSYKENQDNKINVLEEIRKEINNNEIILGVTDVVGEGIIVDLVDDASGEYLGEVIDPNDWWTRTIHDNDIVNVINHLKIAGAEAISLNGQRITDKSDILCWGVFVELDGVKIPGPFNIKVIGNKEKIYSYMLSEDGYLSYLKIRGIDVNVYKHDEVKIMASDRKVNYQYMKESKPKK
jgi:uncharacterized protein YlxW (UPF0749 family)